MDKAILIMDMPSCCEECFALDFHGDYPRCIITDEQRGYNFNTHLQRMPHCPLLREDDFYNIYGLSKNAKNFATQEEK